MYTVIDFRYTQTGWYAGVKDNQDTLMYNIRLNEVNAQDCRNFQDAYRTCACLPYDPQWGYVMDVPAAEPEIRLDLTPKTISFMDGI